MSFNTPAGATALVSVLTGLTGMGSVQIGVPESIGKQVSAYVTAGGSMPVEKTTGTLARDQRYNCTLCYRVDDSETAAETTLMGLLDLFIAALMADRTLGNVCKNLTIDLTLADSPQYLIYAGKEYREFPVVVTLRQYDTFNPNP